MSSISGHLCVCAESSGFRGYLDLFSLIFILPLIVAAGMSSARAADFAMTCPAGWLQQTEGQMLLRCVAPGQDAFIEVYANAGTATDLAAYLDQSVAALMQNGLPFHQFRKESPGNVSGIPALTREYSGTANNALFHSYVVATTHGGQTYFAEALYLADRTESLQPLIRQALNSWSIPSVEQANAARPPAVNPDPDLPDTSPVMGSRAYASKDQCIDYLCRPFSAQCKDYDESDRVHNHFRYLLCSAAWDKCYSYCNGYWSMALTCTKEAVTQAQGYWISACAAVAHDQKAMQDCFTRGNVQAAERLKAMSRMPECKGLPN